MKNFDWKKYIGECLESTYYCALGTNGKEGVWVNPVYFAYDDKYNFYFISQPASRHMQSMAKNPQVSLAIYSTAQDTQGHVAGIQLAGEARILTDEAQVKHAYDVYYGRKYPSTRKHPEKDEDPYINNPEWQFVEVVPIKMYYFDTRFFGETRQEVPLPL